MIPEINPGYMASKLGGCFIQSWRNEIVNHGSGSACVWPVCRIQKFYQAKITLQDLRRRKFDWDTILPRQLLAQIDKKHHDI